ncbi:thiamine pyrophosphate-binding protein [Yinghuangia seranimata]|uniref:thiamine pyrophosphate-binding protein n=1 Tax=Yinghuangia seranimata TaxID=408067 RepID=UPI00248D0B80|nr:thiamine pyrophosphate-binding protein [Yinghuangia seranimata]MDI2131189.1 thiamine pyrophosphate-binding protein [Yinghuangia seranimata]
MTATAHAGARIMPGSAAIAEAMIAAGCRFFAGYPMTPFTEVLETMAARLPDVGGVCVNAESELEAVGMAWGAAATGTPAATGSTGQGLSLMQESLAEIVYSRLPLVVLNMARAQGDYFQATRGGGHGDYRHLVLAPCGVPEAAELTQLAFHLAEKWRAPVLVMGDYYLAHTHQSVSVTPLDFGPLPPRDWALDGSTGGTGAAKLVSPLSDAKQRHAAGRADAGYDLAEFYHRHVAAMERMVTDEPPRHEAGFTDDAELVVIAYGTPGGYVRQAVRELRAEGRRIGWLRPITLVPFPSDVVAEAARRAGSVAVYENNQGQMLDDVRLAVLGSADVRFIGGLSLDPSGFGIAPDLDVALLKRRIADLHDAVTGRRRGPEPEPPHREHPRSRP